jgi:hypothetical protein
VRPSEAVGGAIGLDFGGVIRDDAYVAKEQERTSDEIARVRARLAEAGLLVEPGPPKKRPDPDVVARARVAAGKGKSLVDFVIEGRG